MEDMKDMKDMEDLERLREKEFAERVERIQNTMSRFKKNCLHFDGDCRCVYVFSYAEGL